MSTIADRIVNARIHARLSQSQLSKLSGISRTSISKYENGATPSLARIEQIAKALNVSKSYIAFGEGLMPLLNDTELILGEQK